MDKNTLMQLSKEDVLSQRLPLVDLLVDSLYYPNSRLDGGVIKYSNMHLRDEELVSFVYSFQIQRNALYNSVFHLFSCYKALYH